MKKLLLVTAIVGLSACSDGSDSTGSAEVDTRTLRADIRAEGMTASQTDVAVSLSLSSDSEQKIKLENGDKLTATTGSETINLSLKQNSLQPVYIGSLKTGIAGTEVTVNLQRTTPPSDDGFWFPSEQVAKPDFGEFFIDAPESKASLPADFAISTPAAATEYSSSSDIVALSWTPSASGNDMRLLHTTTCPPEPDSKAISLSSEIAVSDDTGSQAVPIIELLSTQGTATKCSIQLDLIREASGTLDPAYRTGSIVGTQRRTVTITYSP